MGLPCSKKYCILKIFSGTQSKKYTRFASKIDFHKYVGNERGQNYRGSSVNLLLTAGEGIWSTGEFSQEVTLLKNALGNIVTFLTEVIV